MDIPHNSATPIWRMTTVVKQISHVGETQEYNSLYSHRASQDLLSPNKSGFCPGDSTINRVLSITDTIAKAPEYNPPLDTRSVYLDTSKALDRVWHDDLTYKLKQSGVSGQLLCPIQRFLKDRKQRTVWPVYRLNRFTLPENS